MPDVLASERLVNSVTAGAQTPADAVVLSGGQTVAAWIDTSSGSSVAKIELYQAGGANPSGEITIGAADEVKVAVTANGFFVVRLVGASTTDATVVAQQYDLSGHAVGGSQLLSESDIRNTPILGQHLLGLEVQGLSDGGFAVGWSRSSGDTMGFSYQSASMVVADATGHVEGISGLVGPPSDKGLATYDANVAFAETADHRLLVTWHVGQSHFGPFPGQYAQFFDLSGHALGSAVALDPGIPADGGPTIDSSQGLAVAALPNGEIAFAWEAGGSVWLSLYPADKLGMGNLTGRTPPVQVATGAGAGEPQIATLPDGRFVVGWSAGGDVMAQVFGGDGHAAGAAFRVGEVAFGTQDSLQLASGAGGVLAGLWRDDSGFSGSGGTATDTSGGGVKLELYGFAQTLSGTAGDDVLTGGPSGDRIDGGLGQDHLYGGGGNDTLNGGGGGDVIQGGLGDDLIIGGPNFDWVDYSASPAGVTVDLFALRATGGEGNDTLSEIEGVYGSAFNDYLRGNHLSNVLSGGAGDDTIEGQAGSDYLDGGEGTDTLVLLGSTSDYFVQAIPFGATVTGPFGTMTALGFEKVQLDSGTMSWSDFMAKAFNGLRYIASNPDLISSLHADEAAARQQWLDHGKADGRPLATFDPIEYAASNPDLMRTYYTDTRALTLHYIQTGFAEGRPTATFDALEYGASNPDLLIALGPDVSALARHWVVSGWIEGRSTATFDPLEYGASNDDLARVFGANPQALLQNYVHSGVYEGRPTTGFDGLQYAAANDDLARAFGTDAHAAMLHYLTTGANEGRATSGFDTTAYFLSYHNTPSGPATLADSLNNWLTVGAKAGLLGDELFGRDQTSHLADGSLSELENFTTSGRFHVDKDWFQISAPGLRFGGYLGVTVEGFASGHGSLGDARLDLYDSAGNLLASDVASAGHDAHISYPLGAGPDTSPHTYYVVVSSASGAEGTYDVVWGESTIPSAPLADGWVT